MPLSFDTMIVAVLALLTLRGLWLAILNDIERPGRVAKEQEERLGS